MTQNRDDSFTQPSATQTSAEDTAATLEGAARTSRKCGPSVVWVALLASAALLGGCSDDAPASSDAGTVLDDDATDDDATDDDATDDDATDDDATDDDATDDDATDDDATDDDATDDDAMDDDATDDDGADDDAADDDAMDDDAADDDAMDDDAADDDAMDDDAADDDAMDDDAADDDGADDDAGSDDDAGPGDDPADEWAGCPPAESWVAEAGWPVILTADPGATYCATFNESRTLEEELAAKSQLRFTAGSYALPADDEVPAPLPLCLRDASGAITTLASGSLRTEVTPEAAGASYNLYFDAVVADAADSALSVSLFSGVKPTSDGAFLLDGREVALDGESYQSFDLCADPENCFPPVVFTSCQYESGTLNVHRVEFDAGSIAFELRLGRSFAGTEPGAFVRASGTFAGVDFEQTDYFKLVYHPSHHHFERQFAVLFDEPIDGACGVEVTSLEPFGDDVPDEAYTVDCELNRLDALSVVSHELSVE